jgi:ankyrin repeat protein
VSDVRVDQCFVPERLGNALAKLWTVNGLTLELADLQYSCAFTTERPANPGMTEDGHVYSVGNITRWLNDKDTSPNTNARLAHKRITRLLPFKDLIDQFFKQCTIKRDAARKQIETNLFRACGGPCRYHQMRSELEKIEAYVATCTDELAAWNRHLDIINGVKDAFKKRMMACRRMAATQIQVRWRSFSAQRCTRAATLIQRYWRSFLAMRRRARGRCKHAPSLIRSAVRSFNAQGNMLRLLEHRDKTNQLLLKSVQKQAGRTCGLVDALLQRNADVNCADEDGSTPLISAASQGSVELVKLLCDRGANLEKTDLAGQNALVHSCYYGHLHCIQALVEATADVVVPPPRGQSALIITCQCGHEQSLLALMVANADPDEQDIEGVSALIFSAGLGHVPCVRTLIEARASVDKPQYDGLTALMVSTLCGHEQCARLLVESGAAVNTAQPDGETSLTLSCRCGNDSCTRLFIEARAAVDHALDAGAEDGACNTALMFACTSGHEQCARALIGHRADVNAHDNHGYTALMKACVEGNCQCARALIDAEADVNSRDNHGYTALMKACVEGNCQCARALLETKTTPKMKSADLRIAYSIARENGHAALALMLKR